MYSPIKSDAHAHPWLTLYAHPFGAEYTPLPSSCLDLFSRCCLASPHALLPES